MDMKVNSNEVKEVLKLLKNICEEKNISQEEFLSSLKNEMENTMDEPIPDKSAWTSVLIARHTERPTALDYINAIFEDFFELHGDRLYSDDKSIIGGLAMFSNMAVTVIGIQKGRNIEENIKRNFGMPHPDGYRKALRLMKQAERFNRPIICFVDTPGAYPGIEAEERGQWEAIARNLLEMSNLTVPVISIIIGEGGSGGALALSLANQVWMLKHSIYSILSPEGFASILWKDSTKAKDAATLMKLTAKELLEYKIIEAIIEEFDGGVHINPKYTYSIIKNKLEIELRELKKLSPQEIKNQRRKKFRSYV